MGNAGIRAPFDLLLGVAAILAATAMPAASVLAQPEVPWRTVDGGGGTSAGGSFTVRGTIGQPEAGTAVGGTFDLRSGFWTSPESLLTVAAAGNGSGTVTDTASGDGIACTSIAGVTSGDCDERVVTGNEVTLVATPNAFHSIAGWSGCDSTSTTSEPGDTCHLAPTDDATVTATFGIDTIDLSISLVDSADPLPGGQNLVYTITVANLGPDDATGVVLASSLPAGTSLVATSGCDEDPVAAPTCTLGDLVSGADAVVTLELAIAPAPPSSITHTVSVSAAEAETKPYDNIAFETTLLDDNPPVVILVDSVATTDDGQVSDCETIHGRAVQRLRVRFDEAMLDAPGSTTLGDVTHPSSWLLVSAGADRTLDTTACGAPAGDDELISLASVGYDSGSRTATLVPAEPWLKVGMHRLFACGTGASVLTDLAGNPLDGDKDGIGGNDFALRFRTDPDNQLANGHFDCNLSDWLLVSTNPSEIVLGPDDADGSPDSGSAAVENLTASSELALGQCAPMQAPGTYRLDARIRLATATDGLSTRAVCSFYDAAECGGSQIGSPLGSSTFLADTGGNWVEIDAELEPSAGAASALCSIELLTASGESFAADVDQVQLVQLALFADGFESGDISAWSRSTP